MPSQNVSKLFYKHISTKGFSRVVDKSKLSFIGDGKCTAFLKIDEAQINHLGYLHGGFSATLVDCFSSLALLTKCSDAFVTTDMHLSYLKGAKVGQEIVINGFVVKIGKKLAFLETTICDKDTNKMLVKGTQTSFIIN
ncbi:Acyl-coenzyme A thioesterase 13-like Protein [Tribolium castaneum]|uniref:Acyl-coenzyme A thioesterase 13-like Protein n=1 Tax=Tribolium castaneum TaxID=7070 RepID=D6X3Y0_TRICA|nr:Acyl-coenzyme A thioesterase 13-like Protein [Tribolium castaneum]